MKQAKRFLLGIAAALGVFTVPACADAAHPAAEQPVLTVAAASDLRNAFSELGPLFTQETGARVVFQFGSSGDLARQITQGAPFDLFASASEDYVAIVISAGAGIAETEQLYALGRIVLVTPAGSSLRPTGLADLLRPEVRHVALANPEHAPYGRAARQALEKAGLWEKVAGKVVYGENVSQALQFVQTGNADVGIVARSLADAPAVSTLPIDDSLYTLLQQSMVVVKGAKQERLARAFAAFVNSGKGRPVMERHGFALPEAKR
ncbi:MAG: molybdate ABC transporter substrate-binding protein [Chloroflexota bacterium]